MKEGEGVGDGTAAIVLATLFQPTQNGNIKDVEAGLDLLAAATRAKQLGRNTTFADAPTREKQVNHDI